MPSRIELPSEPDRSKRWRDSAGGVWTYQDAWWLLTNFGNKVHAGRWENVISQWGSYFPLEEIQEPLPPMLIWPANDALYFKSEGNWHYVILGPGERTCRTVYGEDQLRSWFDEGKIKEVKW